MSGIGSCLQWYWLSRSSGTGWRMRPIHLLFGQIIKIRPIFTLTAGLILIRQGGCGSWVIQFQILTYHQGSRHTKPDALSRQFSPSVEELAEETIIPLSCMAGASRWTVEQEVQEALKNDP